MSDAPSESSSAGSRPPRIEIVSAITLGTHDMPRAVAFYQQLGFMLQFGGASEDFTSFVAGPTRLNLIRVAAEICWTWWGRVIFHVSDVDALYQLAVEAGLVPQAPPADAHWGERYFHLTDPDGHELSFAQPLADR